MTNELEVPFARLMTEHWKLIQVLSRAASRLPLEAQPRVQAQLRFAESQLAKIGEESNFRCATFEGRPLEPGLPVTAMNKQDFAEGAVLTVLETIEPAIVVEGRIIQFGKVLVAGESADASRN